MELAGISCCAVGICDDHRLEFRIEQRRNIKRTFIEERDDLVADLVRVHKTKLLDVTQIDMVDNVLAEITAQNICAFLADGNDLYGLAVCDQAGGRVREPNAQSAH